jgi:hypothetical protein
VPPVDALLLPPPPSVPPHGPHVPIALPGTSLHDRPAQQSALDEHCPQASTQVVEPQT